MNNLDQNTSSNPLPESILLKAILFSVVYFSCAVLGNLLSLNSLKFVNFWLPSGLFVATLLINKRRHWPVLIIAAVIANICFDIMNGKALPISLLFSAVNSLEAIVGTWLVLRFTGESPTLSGLREVFIVLVCAAMLSTSVGATFGAAIVTEFLGGNSYWQTWVTWW